MRRTRKIQWGWQLMRGMVTVMLVLTIALLTEGFTLVCHAQSAGKVKANSANIRKEADPNSDVVGSAAKNAEVTINFQVKGTDNMVWYQIFVDAGTTGYIRSDLVTITDGSTPPEQSGAEAAGNNETSNASNNDGVTPVNPVSAKIKGSDSVRVRSDASTQGNNIVTTVKKGKKVTVKGTATASDGNVWYQVSFKVDGEEMTGFIRSDYVELSEELKEVVAEEPSKEPETKPEPEKKPTPEPQKDYETALVNDVWYLYDYGKQKQYKILDFISANEQYAKLYEESQEKVKSQKTVIIVLVILSVIMTVAVAFLIFKIKDMMDSAYFRQVEQETILRRTADRPQKTGSQRTSQSAGSQSQSGKRSVQGGSRSGGNQPQQGGRPVQQGSRPVGSQPQQGSRPVQGGQPQQGGRPVQGGSRPAGSQAQQGGRPVQGGSHPAGSQTQQGGRSVQGGSRPTGSQMQQGGRPVQSGSRPTGQPVQGGSRPAGSRSAGGQRGSQGGRREETGGSVRGQEGMQGQYAGRRTRNFMDEDDEFEYDHLHRMDEDDE